jgi:uncharacterized delta-60 repeat protein
VVVGAPKSDNAVPGLKDTGSVAVYNSTNAATPVMKKYGAVAKAGLGNSVAVGDVDSDGRADIIVGASLLVHRKMTSRVKKLSKTRAVFLSGVARACKRRISTSSWGKCLQQAPCFLRVMLLCCEFFWISLPVKKFLLPLFALVLPTVCLALQPGDVDTAFGSGGVAYMDSGKDDSVKSVIEQADGKLLLGGFSSFRNPDDTTNYQISVARFNQDGTLDTSFDGDGKMQADPVPGRNIVFAMIQQADQKLVFAGCSCNGWGSSDGWLIARFNADGSVDTGFGTGGSRVLGYAEGFASGSPPASIYSMIQQQDGKLVLVGDAADATTYTQQITVVRMASDGTFDTSFGDQGKVSLSILGGYGEFARGVVQQPDGKLVLAATLTGFLPSSNAMAVC